ncbi:hypothetical protein LTR37_000840 [Vermiconidia calcicola]|uniref:Uncharacterized protein n=1 Tax=Vermiconidia calcicola TaxID=1690605 RepID=A0ACC3NWX5_9PEZI|nr:hypothetical protein LTR37_000840 [Vermiconidia calcicola]
MTATLVEADEHEEAPQNHLHDSPLIGQNVSSLHRLKDIDNRDGGFFVFGDISCRRVGRFRLQFNLYEFRKDEEQVLFVESAVSEAFTVVNSKEFRGLMESTTLSRTFSDQGVRLRLRKEPRALTGTKRAWDGTPPASSTSPIHPSTYDTQADHRSYGYGAPLVKRPRTDSDHTPQMYPPPQYAGGPVSQYGNNMHGSSAWSGQAQQSFQNDSAVSLSGSVNPDQTQPLAVAGWQRGGHQGLYSAPVGGTPANPFFTSSNIASSLSRNPPNDSYGQQYQQQYSSRTSSDAYNPGHGLRTPTSGSDNGLGSTHQHGFFQQPADIHNQLDTIGSGTGQVMAQAIQPSQGMQNYGLHHVSVDLPDYRYQSMQTGRNAAYRHPSQSGTLKLEDSNFPSSQGTYTDSSRDAYQTRTGPFSDSGMSLNTGMLNRSFEPMQPTQQQPSYANLTEDELADFKQQPQSYPTPNQTSPMP